MQKVQRAAEIQARIKASMESTGLNKQAAPQPVQSEEPPLPKEEDGKPVVLAV